MQRNFNYTDRKPIPRSAVKVKVNGAKTDVPSFEAKLDLSKLGLPEHAKVYLEAYHRASYMRFDFGRIGNIRAPDDCRLIDIDGGATAQFRVKVVDETMAHGCLLAEIDGVVPFDADEALADRTSILPVVIADLEDQVWRVDFDTPDGRPVLELNKRTENPAQLAFGDEHFFALVYPSVVRQILHRAMFSGSEVEIDGPAEDWQVQWLKFGCALPGVMPPPELEIDDSESANLAKTEWIESVVDAFCTHHKTIDRFNRLHKSEADS